ncbi:hypothetical protein AA313_de0206801 [Arthrobotrys entomopaga]|nr:hypothetical protein AA313_de0206801 [Arthrobotrys entomopaga]
MLSRVYNAHSSFYPSWIHFEGRECFMAEGVIDHFTGRKEYKTNPCIISVEFEMYGRPGLDRLMGMCDVAFVAEAYMKAFLEDAVKGSRSEEDKEETVSLFADLTKRLMKRKATMFVTVGAGGAYLLRYHGGTVDVSHFSTPEIDSSDIIETTGAGDTFIGAAIYALGYKNFDATKAARIAVNVASRKCMQVGYDMLGNFTDGFGSLEDGDTSRSTEDANAIPPVRPSVGLL